MSELTQCNYCNLKQIKANAKKKRMKVVLLPSSFMGGIDVFVVPRKCSLCSGEGVLLDTNMMSHEFDEPYECYQCKGTGKGPSTKEIKTWKDCSDKLPNGDKNYQKYHVSWMMEIGNRCEC